MKRPHYVLCNGEEWEKQRMRALVRDGFRCQAQRLGLTAEPCPESRLRFLNVHHLKPRIQGGNHDLGNLITLCREHHARLHPHLRFELESEEEGLEFPLREL